MPTDIVAYLDRFGLFGGGVLFVWAIHTGRLYLPREIDFMKKNYEERIDELVTRLELAENELNSQRGLLNKIVDQAIKHRDAPS